MPSCVAWGKTTFRSSVGMNKQVLKGLGLFFLNVSSSWKCLILTKFLAFHCHLSSFVMKVEISSIAEKNAFMIKNCFDRLKSYVVDGQLLEDYVLDNVKALLECLRDSNVTIRWLMLHNNCTNQSYKESIQKAYDKNSLVTFILKLAQFEN